MKIGAYEMEKYFKGTLTRLWNRLPVEDVNETEYEMGIFNDDNYGKREPLPEMTAAILHCVSQWTKNRRVYRFNAELFKELHGMGQEMSEDEEIPADFLRLPFDAISIQIEDDGAVKKIRDQGLPLDTSWGTEVTLVITTTKPGEIHEWPCLLATMWVPLGSITAMVLPLGKTVGESVNAGIDFLHNGTHWIAKDIQRVIKRTQQMYPDSEFSDEYEVGSLRDMIQLVLYLNSTNADVTDEPEEKPLRKERKRLEQKTKVKVTDVGFHVGRLLKETKRNTAAVGTGTGNRKRAHFRRAHWHHYWTGRKGEQKQILKWVGVMVIHPDEIDELPTVMKVGD